MIKTFFLSPQRKINGQYYLRLSRLEKATRRFSAAHQIFITVVSLVCFGLYLFISLPIWHDTRGVSKHKVPMIPTYWEIFHSNRQSRYTSFKSFKAKNCFLHLKLRLAPRVSWSTPIGEELLVVSNVPRVDSLAFLVFIFTNRTV